MLKRWPKQADSKENFILSERRQFHILAIFLSYNSMKCRSLWRIVREDSQAPQKIQVGWVVEIAAIVEGRRYKLQTVGGIPKHQRAETSRPVQEKTSEHLRNFLLPIIPFVSLRRREAQTGRPKIQGQATNKCSSLVAKREVRDWVHLRQELPVPATRGASRKIPLAPSGEV